MPTPTTYTYSLSLDAPDGEINSDKLEAAIRASSIATALESINTGDGLFSISFRDVLSTTDRTTLDGDNGSGGTKGEPSNVHPAKGLIESTDNTPNAPTTQSVDVVNQPRTRDDGVIYAVPKPSSFGFVMCDRDIKVNTCVMDPKDAFQDLKMNTQTNKEENWDEMALVGVYKDVAGVMTMCDDQADADTNGVLSVWDFVSMSGGIPIVYEIRDGLLYVDPALPTDEIWDHRAYAVIAPEIPAAMGGSIMVFDAYLGANPDNLVEALSPQATILDPTGPGGEAAAVLRLYVVHPAGSKLSHVLRLVTYRAPGTF